jgi:hypothetical protein
MLNPMRRSRQVLAVVVVTTAMCADHVATASCIAREPIGRVTDVASEVADLASGLAGRFVTRLSQSFQRTVPGVVPLEARQPKPTIAVTTIRPQDVSADVQRQSFSPFQFRLPPPR